MLLEFHLHLPVVKLSSSWKGSYSIILSSVDGNAHQCVVGGVFFFLNYYYYHYSRIIQNRDLDILCLMQSLCLGPPKDALFHLHEKLVHLVGS